MAEISAKMTTGIYCRHSLDVTFHGVAVNRSGLGYWIIVSPTLIVGNIDAFAASFTSNSINLQAIDFSPERIAEVTIKLNVPDVSVDGPGSHYDGYDRYAPAFPSVENSPELIPVPITPEDIQRLLGFRRRFVSGYPDGTFRPDGKMTRAEMIQMLFNISSTARFYATETRFTDVSVDDWFFEAVAYLENFGALRGFPDGSLRPNEPITYAEFAALTAEFFDFTSVVDPEMLVEIENHWGADYADLVIAIGRLEYFGITEVFDPGAPILARMLWYSLTSVRGVYLARLQ